MPIKNYHDLLDIHLDIWTKAFWLLRVVFSVFKATFSIMDDDYPRDNDEPSRVAVPTKLNNPSKRKTRKKNNPVNGNPNNSNGGTSHNHPRDKEGGDLVRTSEVILFPDPNKICVKYMKSLMTGNKEIKCRETNCKGLHGRDDEPPSSLLRFLLTLDEAKESLDICIFVFTHHNIAQLLCKLKAQGVEIRILAHAQEIKNDRCQLDMLQRKGIPIKVNREPTNSLMHNKFVIIDRKLIMSGSFNWTYAAVNKNNESVTITSDTNIVKPHLGEFEQLWSSFEDRKSTDVRKPGPLPSPRSDASNQREMNFRSPVSTRRRQRPGRWLDFIFRLFD